MSEGNDLWLLLFAGPAGAVGLYWGLYRYYRNTDKSHAFEHETTVVSQPVTGSDQKVDEIKGTQKTRIADDNVREFRKRVTRLKGDAGTG